MPFPNFKNKHLHDSFISPQYAIRYKKILGIHPRCKAPEGVVICYEKSLIDYIVKKYNPKKYRFICGDFYLINNKIGVAGNFGFGAPIAAMVMEEMIAFGVKKFITIGAAGTLSRHLKIGDIVLCDKAIRDEGTSHHYFRYAKYSYPSPGMFAKIKKMLDESGQKYFTGQSWTIDAFYRETIEEAKKYQKEGVLTIEMEASALFAVAKYRKAEIAAIFAVSDSHATPEWKPKFHSKKFKNGLQNVFEIAKKVLTS